jgi:hypothetical protein
MGAELFCVIGAPVHPGGKRSNRAARGGATAETHAQRGKRQDLRATGRDYDVLHTRSRAAHTCPHCSSATLRP